MRFFFTIATVLLADLLLAQAVDIYGSVVDAKTQEPLIGVSIAIEGTTNGTFTDLDGKFQLSVEPGSYNITATYVGYETSTRTNLIVTSRGNDALNFELQSGVTISEVVVRANPFQVNRLTPVSLQKLSPEEIKTYPGSNNDVARTVQSLPGVSGSIGGFRNDIIIRGGAPNENVYYLDGIEIPSINHFATQGSAGGPVGLLNVDFIQGVELATTAFGARYDNPLSGVLQFDQRTGNPRQRQTNFRISATEAALTTEGPLFKGSRSESNTTFIVSARRSYLQLLFELLELPIRPNYWDYQFKVNHVIDERNTIFLTGVGSIDDFDVSPPDDFDFEQQSSLEQVPIIQQRTFTAGLGWRRRLRDGKGVMNTYLSTNLFNNDFSRYQDNENRVGLVFRNESREWEQKLRYEYTRFLGPWTLTAGANLIRADYDNITTDNNNELRFETDIDFFRYGFFTQATRSLLNNRLDLSVGFRLDDNTFSRESNTLLKTFSPRLSLSYALDQVGDWRVSASAGRYFKVAPFTVLGFQNQAGEFVNRDVPYTSSVHAVAGLERRIGQFGKVSLEGFYKYYSNYLISAEDGISLANKGGDFSVLGSEEVIPEGEGRTYGLELLFQQKLSKNWYGILAYTFFYSEFTNLAGEFLPSSWDNRHLLSFTGGYKLGRNWEFSLRYRLAGGAPFAPVDTEASEATYPELILDFDNFGRSRLDVFSQLDIRIDKKWNFNTLALNVFLDIENVLGQNIPFPPEFGLARDNNGNLEMPRSLVQVNTTSGVVQPTLGIAVDF
ncbi:MAG: TonB-dependent receptor [Bacteroidota bacterium]